MAAAAGANDQLDSYMQAQIRSLPAAPTPKPPAPDPLDAYMQQQLSAPTAPRSAGGFPPVLPPVEEFQPVAPGTPIPPPDARALALEGGGPPLTGGPPVPSGPRRRPGPPLTPASAQLMAQEALGPEMLAPAQTPGPYVSGPAPSPGLPPALQRPAGDPRELLQQALGPQTVTPVPPGPWALPNLQQPGLPPEVVQQLTQQQPPQQITLKPRPGAVAPPGALAAPRPAPNLAGAITPPLPGQTGPPLDLSQIVEAGKRGLAHLLSLGMKPDDAINAVMNQIGTQIHQLPARFQRLGLTPSWTPAGRAQVAQDLREYAQAAQKALRAGAPTPPLFTRNAFGMQPGKANRFLYDLAGTVDYLLSGVTSPSAHATGPLWEATGGAATQWLGGVVKGGVVKAGQAAAARSPLVAQAGQAASRLGEALAIGPGALLQRAVSVPLRQRIALGLAETAAVGKQAATLDAQYSGGGQVSRLIHDAVTSDLAAATDRVTLSPAVRQQLESRARAAGIPFPEVETLANRVVAHANRTAGDLERGGVVAAGTFTRPGPERDTLLSGYVQRALGQQATHLGIDTEHRAALAQVFHWAAFDPELSAAVSAASPLRAGWVAIPDEQRFGLLRGRQVPAPVARFLSHAVDPAYVTGSLSSANQTLQGFQRIARGTARALKGTALTLNPAGWIASFGARGIQAEIAAQRAGMDTPTFLALATKEWLPALQEWRAWQKTGHGTGRLLEAARTMPGFLSHYGTQLGAGSAGPAEAFVGFGGKVHGDLDQLWKYVTYRVLEPKIGPAQAGKLITDHLFNYEDRADLLRTVDQYGLWPFNSFPTKAMGLFLDTLATRPDLVARFPRLQRMLMAEPSMKGSQPQYGGLPQYAQTPTTLPIGGGQFANIGRYTPFAEPLDLLQPHPPGDEESRQNLLDRFLSHTLYGPALDIIGADRNALTGQPITPPGAPPSGAAGLSGAQWQALWQQGKPGLWRGLEGLDAAAAGTTPKASKYAEPQTLLQAGSQALDVPMTKGESFAARKARLTPPIEARGQVANDYVDTLDAGYHPAANPFTPRVARITDPYQAQSRFEAARQNLRREGVAANNYNRGVLTDAGRARLERAYLFTRALADRYDQLSALDQAAAQIPALRSQLRQLPTPAP